MKTIKEIDPNKIFADIKKAIFVPIFAFFKSERGNNLLRNFGPVIVILYYAYQILHLYVFSMKIIPILLQEFRAILPITFVNT